MGSYALSQDIRIGSLTAPLYRWQTPQLLLNSPRGVFSADLIGNELAADTFSFVVRYNPSAPLVYRDTSDRIYRDTSDRVYIRRAGQKTAREYLADVPYGTPCWWSIGTQRLAKGYVQQIERIGKYSWKVTCISAVGLLSDRDHIGGLYAGASFSSIFNSIVGDLFVVSRQLDPSGAAIWGTKFWGWLPYDNARNNLHRLLFAAGAALVPIRANASQYDYSLQYFSASPTEVSDSRVALGASVTAQIPATGVEITEHSFSALAGDEVVSLFDNTGGTTPAADGLLVVFQQPVHDLSTTGNLTVDSSSVNHAVVSGVGTLYGKAYTHSRSIISVGDTSSAARNVKRVTDNCLISSANSFNVANRVLSYFKSAKTVKAKLILNNEKPGDNLSMTDAWGDAITAFISRMELSVTSIRAASVELIEGYLPTGGGNNFSARDIVTATGGTWTAAADGVIRVILIQGGTGGQGGMDGQYGLGDYPVDSDLVTGQLHYEHAKISSIPVSAVGYYWGADRQELNPGGKAGAPGASGKIMIVTQTVQAGDVLTFTVGAGGTAGARNGGLGASGGETSVVCTRSGVEVWSASSADGAQSASGFLDILAPGGPVSFALPGESGHDGGAGGTVDAQNVEYGNTGAAGNSGGSVGAYSGGSGGKGYKEDFVVSPYIQSASGGAGGGAAWGAAGGTGGNATRYTDSTPYLRSGAGGDGANASAPNQPTYGCGGGGGNGGGSGGNVGGVKWFYIGDADDPSVAALHANDAGLSLKDWPASPPRRGRYGGRPGRGSKGSKGGNGCGIIYS